MRKMASFLMICSVFLVPAQADEETFVDDESALVVRKPAGWSRDHNRENGSIRFAGIYKPAPRHRQYALFTVETGLADGFADYAWLDAEEAHVRATLKRVATPFETEYAFELGGKPAPFYTVAGEGPGYDVRIRASALVHEGRLYRVCEHSYNGAHTAAGRDLDRIWQGVSFQEGGADAFQDGEDQGWKDEDEDSGEGEEEGSLDLAPDEDAKAETVEDKVGNFKLVLPAGWNVAHEPQDQPDVTLRLMAIRGTANSGDVMRIEVWRYTSTRPETFTVDTPADFLQTLYDDNKWFEKFFGPGSAKSIRPDVDDSAELGGCEKSAGYVFSGITMQEEERITKAQKLRNRGDKTVEVPVYKPIVVRGRLALLSPNIYLVVGSFRRDIGDSDELVAEFNKILDSFKFYEEGEKPPPLRIGPDVIEDTTAAPENAKARKGSLVHIAKGQKIYRLKIDFVVPPGFQRMEKTLGPDASLMIVAQDKGNNWVKIFFAHQNANALGERQKKYPPKKQQYTEWKSNWESKARGVKMKAKPSKVSLGKVRGDGYAFVEGSVEKFRGTFTALLFDKSGWRTFIEMETRGQGDKVFEKSIKQFFKSLKFKRIK
ncbi:MAG: hypothetical protein ACYSUM_13170 [Planctomycetota bacterium]|jgi:hypothetical protein